ncbi:acyl-CoA thioesterase-1 [Pseudoduganella flava]|uniref:Acyl-CoA thioesterase-1 n=1 Tax=Pseudoduganella flava TaxID=871742 RepID=A0A562PQK4_9BURK|nr:arylesterase [Pseudoduganella flava]QGZ37834.1 arylesterase [Pseudoduganella flava]TWI46658.1 acyl-CoA thioesterase-1 [Pseudoduganella flava]
MVEGLRRLIGQFWLLLGALGVSLLVLGSPASAYSAPKTLLVVGDSLSAEYGLPRGAGWVALLERKLQAAKIDARIVNASVSGETTSGGRTRMPGLLAKHKPDIVIIELGPNDGLRGLPVAAAESNLRAMVKAVRGAGAQVLLVGMRIPPNYGRDYSEKFFAMYGTVSRDEKVALAPFMLDGLAEKLDLFQADRIHPLASAHPRILDNIWPHLLPLLKANSPKAK